MSNESVLTREELANRFREVGLKEGDSVVTHSSFRSLKPIEGGPEVVILALLDVVGPKGNLVFPTFTNYGYDSPDWYFDPAETPCRTGIIPETARKWPGAVRSLHPTHSVTVIGPDAEALTRDHLKYRAVGVGSPLDRLAEMGGKVLLIGVNNTTNTTVHVGEEHTDVPRVSATPLPALKIRLPDGKMIEHQLDTSPSCSTAFEAIDYPLRRKNQLNDGGAGRSKLTLMKGADIITVVGEMIKDKPDILLCTNKRCTRCQKTREVLRAMGRIP